MCSHVNLHILFYAEGAECESPEVQDFSVTLREKTPEEKAAAAKRKTKRRSKSVGTPGFQIRLLPAYLKPIGKMPYFRTIQLHLTRAKNIQIEWWQCNRPENTPGQIIPGVKWPRLDYTPGYIMA